MSVDVMTMSDSYSQPDTNAAESTADFEYLTLA